MKFFVGHLKQLTALLALVACTGTFGGHWIIPRFSIWTLMIVDYSRTTSIGQAIEDTFSGERPCGRCHKLSLAQQAERKHPPAALQFLKTESFLAPLRVNTLAPIANAKKLDSTAPLSLKDLLVFQPPIPPPRIAFA